MKVRGTGDISERRQSFEPFRNDMALSQSGPAHHRPRLGASGQRFQPIQRFECLTGRELIGLQRCERFQGG